MKAQVALILAMLACCPAAAAPGDAIVVTGKRTMTRAELGHAAAQFVRSAAANDTSGQYARRDAYCPRVIGVPDPRARQIVLDRIMEAGDAAGLPRPRTGCAADLAIVFTSDADGLMQKMRRGNNWFFARQSLQKQAELFDSGRAVRWWYNTTAGGADRGSRVATGSFGDAKGSFDAASLPMWTSSLIETSIRVVIGGAVVVVDVEKAKGYPLASIASYAAMVSLAQINARADFSGVPSILAIPAEPDRGIVRHDLSEWDRAYLRALYKLPTNREAWTQRGALRAALIKASTNSAEP